MKLLWLFSIFKQIFKIGPALRLPKLDEETSLKYLGIMVNKAKQKCVRKHMSFGCWEFRILKNCDEGIFKSEVTVYHYTDRPVP